MVMQHILFVIVTNPFPLSLTFQFLCYQNIKTFLDMCQHHFQIRESDLFEPPMLYDLSNFHRVLLTLSKLSQCRKVQMLQPDLM